MAIFSALPQPSDLKERLACIVVGYTYGGQPVTAGQLHAEGAMTALLKDAFEPNPVQTLSTRPPLCTAGRLPISRMAAIAWRPLAVP